MDIIKMSFMWFIKDIISQGHYENSKGHKFKKRAVFGK